MSSQKTEPSPNQISLARHIMRLDRQIERLNALSKRFSWYRLTIILVGIIAIFMAYNWLTEPWVWSVSAVFISFFAIVVYRHRRVERSINRFTLWKQIKSGHLARLSLDWDHIPEYNPLLESNALGLDLDLIGPYSLHRLIDTAISQEGSSLLAQWLTLSEPQLEDIDYRQGITRELEPLVGFRDRLQLEFRLLTSKKISGKQLLKWLVEAEYSANMGNLLVVAALMTTLTLTLIAFTLIWGYPNYWFGSLFIYLIFYLYNQKKLAPLFEATVTMDRELDVFRSLLQFLESYPYTGKQALGKLCKPFLYAQHLPSKQLQRIRISTAAVGLRMNPIMTFLLNVLFPWDFICAYVIDRQRKNLVICLPVWLDTWYELEALISLANFKYLNPSYTYPELLEHMASEAPIITSKEIGHPLIIPETRVCNDFSISSTGDLALITGSNMAGKSTFIKTIGINLSLAFAGGPVCASEFSSVLFSLHSCIHITDSIADGYSYFYAEVRCLRLLLEKIYTTDSYPVLYLIDEIFRGTNNRERLLGSQAFLQEIIGKNGVGLLATHDLELANLAQTYPEITNYHFSDEVLNGQLSFDYTLRNGASPTTNALKIMHIEGLPVPEDYSLEMD